MSLNIIDSFFVSLGLKTDDFKRGEQEVNERTRRLNEQNRRAFNDMEKRGEAVGEAIKGVRNEVIGLGLAFVGANTITGLITSMATGAATADRLGKTMGMTTRQVWAWRQAMGTVGGGAGDADAALSTIESAKMRFRLGQMGKEESGVFGRLGISKNDFTTATPDQILRKIAGASSRLDPQLFANLLQQIGLNGPMVYFLQQGKESVDALLKQMESHADGQQDLAKQTEQLQAQFAELNTELKQGLVPGILELVKSINGILTFLNANGLGNFLSGDGGYSNAWDMIGDAIGGPIGDFMHRHMGARGGKAAAPSAGNDNASGSSGVYGFLRGKGASHETATGIMAALSAESHMDPNAVNPKSGAYGIGQWLGTRKAELFRRYGSHPSLSQQLEFLWWELSGGDHGGKAVLAQPNANATATAMIRRFLRPAPGYETNRDLAHASRYIASHRTSTLHVQHMTVHTQAKDGHQMIRDVRQAAGRRVAVAQADQGVAP